jgi:phosphoribosylamine--glycine ligase
VRDDASVTVVMASEGYPAAPRSGDRISGLEAAAARPGVRVYHAGTATDAAGHLVTAGGRVLAVTGLGKNLGEARERAYGAVGCIEFAGAHVRHDIAAMAAKEEQQ